MTFTFVLAVNTYYQIKRFYSKTGNDSYALNNQ